MINFILNKILKNKKGVNSILGAILTIISVTVISAYVSINRTSWATNEIQSIMDISATDALQDVISSNDLRKEIIAVNESDSSINSRTQKSLVDQNKVKNKVKTAYMEELKRCLKTNNDLIDSIKLVDFDAGLENTMWGVNSTNLITGNQQARPQLFIDATVQVTLNEDPQWDVNSNYKIRYFNAKSTDSVFSKNADKYVSVLGKTNDGKVILTVRTLTRLIYR